MCFFLFGGKHGHKEVKDLNSKILDLGVNEKILDLVCVCVRVCVCVCVCVCV